MRNDFANLNDLGFTTHNGLVHNLEEAQNNVERLYIEDAKKLEVDAVFFRRFYKDNPISNDEKEELPFFSTPAVCILQKTNSFFNSLEHKELHAALWSAGRTEIYVIQTDSRIDIINARKPAIRISDTDVTIDDKDLVLVQSALHEFDDKRFSAHLFGSGTFWEQSDFQEKIDGNSSPYVFLLDYLMEVREQLINTGTIGLDDSTIDKLLITCILIKFLEEIKGDNGKHTLRSIYKKYGVKTFEEGLLKKGLCIEVLGDLAQEFNGKIFDRFSKNEVDKIAKSDLSPIAKFLSSEVDVTTNQRFIWKQYSFKYLPAEVISAIYENFIQAEAERNGEEEKGVVYTPLHLVNLLVDEVMPLDQPELFKDNQFKVLDPSCGSGVFLVAAYKRMLQWWTINNYNKTLQVVYPNKTVAKNILEKNIFGVDIEETAALVSIFGLTIAYLDKLTPKEIWNNLKFKDLRENNVQGINFTDWAKIAKKKNEKFDLVIGNPPFNASQKGTITNKDLKDLFGKKVPRNKLALKFFEAALYFGKKICMIVPSNAFLYGATSQTYRSDIFTNFTVEKIYDFTHLRRGLFHKTADTPVVALIVNKRPSNFQPIEHFVINRELFSEKKIRFEIDYYNRHEVRWDWATDEKMQFIWKTNLIGGGRLFHLIYRLSLLETLKNFLEKKEEKNNWTYSSGYKTNHKKRKKESAAYITGKETIKPKSFNEYGQFEKIIEKSESFAEKRKKELFEGPHIIFKLVLEKSKIPMAFVKEYLCFNFSFVGISSPPKDKAALYEIYNRLFEDEETSNLYQVCILANSSRVVVSHETAILKEDIDNLPYPENRKYLIPSPKEAILINDVLNHYRHLGKAISINSAGKALHDTITQEELQEYGVTFCHTMNEIYAENGKSWQSGQIIRTPMFIHYQFGFGKNDGLKQDVVSGSDKTPTSLIENITSNTGIIHKRIIRNYKHVDGYDCVYLIKPQNRRYWLQSIALRDVDDTFMDLKKAGF